MGNMLLNFTDEYAEEFTDENQYNLVDTKVHLTGVKREKIPLEYIPLIFRTHRLN